ncbi:MAG: preprotein translocase subunit SecY [bacterium]|nr:preprotein translocase subunit SecY [bacterium]
MFRLLTDIWKTPDLRQKILFTLGIIVLFRLAAHVPIPGVDLNALRSLVSGNQILQLLDLFSGGTLFNFSIIALGLNPYINASIIMQLLGVVVPQIEALQKEGEYGRQKINQYTRYLTVPIAIVQSYGVIVFLQRSGGGVLLNLNLIELVTIMATLVAGTIMLMWLGELITEQGIGNGISILIFAGIVGRLPVTLLQTKEILTPDNLLTIGLVVALGIILIVGVIIGNEGQRQILIQYARRIRGNRLYGGQTTHLPIRINQAGVIPIIFAVSIILVPGMLGTFFATSQNHQVANIAKFVRDLFNDSSYFYSGIYFVLVLAFTYVYTSIVFNPVKVADEIKKYGGFIPGIRPGKATSDYLNFIATRLTLVGGSFLGVVAVMPFIITNISHVSTLAFGGTGLLIVISVILETSKQLESQLIMRSYEGFLNR